MSETRGLDRLHTWTGLGLVLVAGAYSYWVSAAISGRAIFVERSLACEHVVPYVAVVAMVLLALHAALGLRRARRARREGVPDSDWVRLQRLSGILVAAFAAFHFWHVGGLGGESASQLYDRLGGTLGLRGYLAVYLVGITSVALHLGVGTFRALSRRVGDRGVVRGLAVLTASAVWLVAINSLSHFVVGESLLW